MSLTNYNSTHSLSEYEVGNTYAFCVHNADAKKFIKADENTVKLYSSALEKTINDINVEKGVEIYKTLRVVGVVVGKTEATDENDESILIVMFKTKNNDYVLNHYIVGSDKVKNIVEGKLPLKTVI